MLVVVPGGIGCSLARPTNMTPQKTDDQKEGNALGGFLMVLAFIGIYLALQLWILPGRGVST